MQNPLLLLIKSLLQHKLYLSYREYLTDIPKDLQELYKFLDKVHEHSRDISFEEFALYCTANTTDKETCDALLTIIEKTSVGDDLITELLQQYQERSLAHKIALTAIAVTEGKQTFDKLQELLKQREEVVLNQDEFVSDDLEVLYESQVKQLGLRWRLKTLNRMLGSLRKGDFGFIFARPETGKTTFLASEVSYFAEQLQETDGPILWINNEEEGKKVSLRIYQASLGLPQEVLYSDRQGHREKYFQLTKRKIKIFDSATISKRDVEDLCAQHKPSLIIFDQLDKIKGFDGDREDLRLGTVYQWARELAKMYCPVIAVCQADGSGEGKKWLTMENVANAKTAKQAEADWILGIGCTHQEGFEYVRHLHLSKNKLSGDEDTDPNLRHGKQDVLIDPQIARYRDYS